MPEIAFQSGFKSDLQAFLEHKRKHGIPYKNGAYYLADFDRHCSQYYPGCDQLSKSICMAWAIKRPSEDASGFLSRVAPVRQFGKYLVSLNQDAFILPERLGSHASRPIPHIFTTGELRQFFDAVDNMERYYQSVVRHLAAPLMFRYLYCCGLRPQEARSIHICDVNLESGRLFIRESKGRRERVVMIPADLIGLTKAYLPKIRNVYNEIEMLFPDRYGAKMTYDSQKYLFDVCMAKSGLLLPTKPKLYSFRHSYATHRLYLWMKDGKDITAKLPYLTAFMGHSDFACTAYYIHLLPELFLEMSGMDLSQFESLIPEVAPE